MPPLSKTIRDKMFSDVGNMLGFGMGVNILHITW